MILGYLAKNSDPALQDLQRQINYNELHQEVHAVIQKISPIQARDVVWLECRNNIETITFILALWQIGACVVPVDTNLGQTEKDYLYKEIPPQFILGTTETSSLHQYKITTQKNPDILDAHLVQLSSGSTGIPKIMLISLNALIFRSQSNRDHLKLTTSDKTLCSVPLSHSHGLDCLSLPTLFAGGFLLLTDPATSFPYRILEWIEKHKITFFSSLPQMYNYFNQAAEQKSYDLSSLRHAFCGSAALSENTAITFHQKFNLHLKQGYGLAEIGVICVNLRTEKQKYHSIGEPIPGINWFLEDDGELCVQSKSLFSGYYKNAAETELRITKGHLKTEDLMVIDDEGFFYITGRKNDVINVMGQKVYPKEIEQLMVQFPEIKECCVTSKEDAARGQTPVLHLISQKDDLDHAAFEQNLIQTLSQKIEDYKIPRHFVWHTSFPKSPLGKVLKSKL